MNATEILGAFALKAVALTVLSFFAPHTAALLLVVAAVLGAANMLFFFPAKEARR